MSATDALELLVLNHCLRNTAMTQPAALYMALHTADPTETGTAAEVTGGSYAPQTIAFAAATTVSGTGQAANSAAVTFSGLPAATVSFFSIRDSVTSGSGTKLFTGPLSTPIAVTAGGVVTFPIGTVIVTAD